MADMIPSPHGFMQSRAMISKPLAEYSSVEDYDSFLNALAVPDSLPVTLRPSPGHLCRGLRMILLVTTIYSPVRQSGVLPPHA